MIPKNLLRELRKKRNKTFLVSAHIHLEGDALGAELAMARLLRALGKKVFVVNEDEAPAEYEFLPGIQVIRHDTKSLSFDAAVLVDCSDISRIGKVANLIGCDRPVFNIDHHISNTKFGDINWVKPEASCACEMIYSLYEALDVKIKKEDAILLYAGILADTGSFRYATTSAWTHRIVSELMRHKLDVYQIHRRINESLSLKTIRLFGKIIQTLETDKSGKIAWLVMRRSMVNQEPTLVDQTDGLIQFARSLKGVEVALLFKEVRRNREVRINLRSTGKVDVNALAKGFGGGGHKMASGATLHCCLKEAIGAVVREAQKRIS